MLRSYTINYSFKLPEKRDTVFHLDTSVSIPDSYKGMGRIEWVFDGPSCGEVVSSGGSSDYISSSTSCAMIGAY